MMKIGRDTEKTYPCCYHCEGWQHAAGRFASILGKDESAKLRYMHAYPCGKRH